MKRVVLGIVLVLLTVGYADACDDGTNAAAAVCSEQTGFYRAMLCSNCGFGNRKENCVKCGKWVGNNACPARLCSNCGFGSKKNDCVLCGKWIGNSGVPAVLCGNCSFGNKKESCVRCGKWAP
ncbi:MAG: hypothetical protein Q4D98_14030 [Planctomycetia bacterium]|nr:hypothetical protein [Planctomycetia bacterium]